MYWRLLFKEIASMSQRILLYASVEAKSQGGDTHIAYAASNERSLNANLISNLSSSSNERLVFPRLFHAVCRLRSSSRNKSANSPDGFRLRKALVCFALNELVGCNKKKKILTCNDLNFTTRYPNKDCINIDIEEM